MSGAAVTHERSIGELFGDLASETSTLLRQEVKLATVEITQKASYAGKQTSFVAVGACVGMLAMQAMLAAAIVGLAMVMPIWAAALVVGAVLAVVAAVIAMKGIAALTKMRVAPEQTLLSVEDNQSWMKKQVQ